MFYRILLSIAFITTFFLLSCDSQNPTSNNNSNPIIHNDLVFSIQSSINAHQGKKITIDVNLHNYSDSSYELGGFDLYIAYDLNAMTFDSLTTGRMITYCGWFYYTYRNYIDTIDGDEIGTIRITSISDHYFADPICYTPTDLSTNQIAQLHFTIDNDSNLRARKIPIRFFWNDCGDNLVINLQGFDYYVSNKVVTNGVDVSINDSYPNYTGHNSLCDSIFESRQSNSFPIVDFVNGYVRISSRSGSVELESKDSNIEKPDKNLY